MTEQHSSCSRCAVADEVTLHDSAGNRTVRVRKTGFNDTVVWNPGQEKAGSIDDLDGAEYNQWVCIEPANAALQVPPSSLLSVHLCGALAVVWQTYVGRGTEGGSNSHVTRVVRCKALVL